MDCLHFGQGTTRPTALSGALRRLEQDGHTMAMARPQKSGATSGTAPHWPGQEPRQNGTRPPPLSGRGYRHRLCRKHRGSDDPRLAGT